VLFRIPTYYALNAVTDMRMKSNSKKRTKMKPSRILSLFKRRKAELAQLRIDNKRLDALADWAGGVYDRLLPGRAR